MSWTWSSGKPPGLIQDLYLQVVPAKSEEDERREVVDRIFSRFASGLAESDDNFIQAHTSGNGQIVHFQVTDEEQSEGRKCVRLVPNSTYEISLGVITSERYVQRSNVSRIRLGFLILTVVGTGELSKSSRKSRKVELGANTLVSRSLEPSSMEASLKALSINKMSDVKKTKVQAKWGSQSGRQASASGDGFTGAWLTTPGINILCLRMEDLDPVYHRCFQTCDYRDDFVSSSAVADLFTELSPVGAISKIRDLPEKHLWIVTTCVGWEVSNSSTKLGELLGSFLVDLGASREDADALTEASDLTTSGSGKGCRPFAFAGITPISSTTAFSMPPWTKNAYTDAEIQIALSFDDSNWFPSFKRTGEHWQVWTGAQNDASSTEKRFQRIKTSKGLKLRRNHIVLNELEEICKHFAPSASDSAMRDFCMIIFDMIRGYNHGLGGANKRDGERETSEHLYEIHDPDLLPSPKAFSNAVASLSIQLENVLSKLLESFPIASQLVEAGVVEFLVSRMDLKDCDFKRASKSLWLLISLAFEEPKRIQTPRQYSTDTCPILLDYSHNAQPRLLPEIHRRGGVEAVSKMFEQCWSESAKFANYHVLHRLAVFTLHVAEMRSSVLEMRFECPQEGEKNRTRESVVVRALKSRLPIKEKCARNLNPLKGKRVVMAEVDFTRSPFEPEKVQAWGPGWASSGEMLGFSESSQKQFKDSIVLIPAAETWKMHSAVVLQSCRLVWLAGCAGAAAVVFVWPGPLVQQIHPNLNFAQQSEIPSFIIPQSREVNAMVEIMVEGEGGALVTLTDLAEVFGSKESELGLTREFFTSEGLPEIARQMGEQFHTLHRQILCRVPKHYQHPKRPIRVLCLDGGGVKGISTICMLKTIFDEIKKAEKDSATDPKTGKDKTKLLAHYFDLIVGTSAGGIIAMAMGSGMKLDDIEAFYNKSVHEIFASRDTYWEQLQRGPGASAARRLQEIIMKEWPERVGSSSSSADASSFTAPLHQDYHDLGRLPGACMVSTLVSREPTRCCMLKSYLSNGGASIPFLPAVHRATILQCIRATSAAPYYLEEMLCHKDCCTNRFYRQEDLKANITDLRGSHTKSEPFHLDPVITTYRFVDGAISVNNPSCAAILEARSLYPNHPLIVVSLGTGNGLSKVPLKT